MKLGFGGLHLGRGGGGGNADQGHRSHCAFDSFKACWRGEASLVPKRKQKNKKTKKACVFGRVERRRQRGNVLFSARACSHSLGLKKRVAFNRDE